MVKPSANYLERCEFESHPSPQWGNSKGGDMKLVTMSLVTFILFLAGMTWMVIYMYVSGRPAVVTSLPEVVFDVVALGVAMVIAVVALKRYLRRRDR